MKTPVCKICGGAHYKTFCPKAPKKPIQTKKKMDSKSSLVKKPNVAKYKTVKKPVKKKKPSRSQLVKRLDTVFSQYIRLSYANNDGNVDCYTCGNRMHWKDAQNGHFFTRSRYPTRWSEDNCRVQDYRCNVILNGNYIIYTRKMIDEIGVEGVDKLEKLSKSTDKMPTSTLQEMITAYSEKVKQIATTKKIMLK